MRDTTRGVVLLVEDESGLAVMLGEWLEQNHYDVDYASNGLDAVNLAHENAYDAIVMDVSLPRLSGFDACRRLRSEGANTQTPVVLVTARDTLDDKIEGLEAGADDYVTKPFFPAELEARITALVRRRRSEVTPAIVSVGDIMLDPRSLRVQRAGEEIDLTPTGFRILQILMRESPKMVTREQLVRELWGQEIPESDALRSHLYVLRKAIDRGHPVQILHTYPQMGYRALPMDVRDAEKAREARAKKRKRGKALNGHH